MRNKKRIIVVASIGGHWIQLLRIVRPLEEHYDIVYISTHPKCKTMIGDSSFYNIEDFNRWNAWKMIPASFKLFDIVLKEKPSAIITTGAAPGLLSLIIGRFLGAKTVWIDSIANVQELSGCGHIACYIANHVFTQWPQLANEKVHFAGNIFG